MSAVADDPLFTVSVSRALATTLSTVLRGTPAGTGLLLSETSDGAVTVTNTLPWFRSVQQQLRAELTTTDPGGVTAGNIRLLLARISAVTRS